MYSVERSLYVIKDCERIRDAAVRKAELAKRKTDTGALLRHRVEVNRIDLTSECGPTGDKTPWNSAVSALSKNWEALWFSENYISPWAWKPVLQQYPTLRLSLAHFGGDEPPYSHWARPHPPPVRTDLATFADREHSDRELLWDDQLIALMLKYENLHVDLSYFELSEANLPRFRSILETYPTLIDRILFGTDWWMIERNHFKYDRFATSNRTFLDKINPELWERFACVNPVKFYRLRENAEAIAAGLRANLPKVKGQSSANKALQQEIARGLAILQRLT